MTAASFWSHDSVRTAMGAVWAARPDTLPTLTGGASIDSRQTLPGQVFFALRGEHTDGHRFLAQARDAGAALAVIDEPDAAKHAPASLPIVRVADARAALGKLAAAYRTTLGPVRVVAITGSNGKTTTTRMIDACLAGTLRGSASRKSFNNDLGVPITVLSARPGDQYLLCEVGANAPGEIEHLSRIIRPHVVVITSIGRAHLDGFGSIEGVAAEKASLATHLEPGGVVIMPADCPPLAPWRDRLGRVLTIGTGEEADLRVGEIAQSPEGLTFSLNGREQFSLPVLGEHNAFNAAAAVAVARRLGVDAADAAAGLAAFEPPPMRLALRSIAGVTVINDAYNANPDSMLAALRTLTRTAPAGSRRVAVIGEMLELGPGAATAHAEIASTIIAESLADHVVAVGEHADHMLSVLLAGGITGEAHRTLDTETVPRVAATFRTGDTVLLKGSRRVGLERIAAAWTELADTAVPGGGG